MKENFLRSFDINGYGLSAQRLRVNVISSNIANALTTRTDEGGPYKRRDVVLRAFNFNDLINDNLEKNGKLHEYEDALDEGSRYQVPSPPIMGVLVDKIARDDSAPRLKYDPKHPDADHNGYVAYPNVNPVIEMADLIEATRSYQANVAAYQSVKNMAENAISMFQG
jgi:flagellar basal-body rod protein FlgC